jgi:hypothetical protein
VSTCVDLASGRPYLSTPHDLGHREILDRDPDHRLVIFVLIEFARIIIPFVSETTAGGRQDAAQERLSISPHRDDATAQHEADRDDVSE